MGSHRKGCRSLNFFSCLALKLLNWSNRLIQILVSPREGSHKNSRLKNKITKTKKNKENKTEASSKLGFDQSNRLLRFPERKEDRMFGKLNSREKQGFSETEFFSKQSGFRLLTKNIFKEKKMKKMTLNPEIKPPLRSHRSKSIFALQKPN